MLLQLLDTGIGGAAAAIAFEAERLGDDADGEDALVARSLGDDGRGAGAGAAAHTGGHKAHMGALERLFDLGDCFLGGGHADLGNSAPPPALRELEAGPTRLRTEECTVGNAWVYT